MKRIFGKIMDWYDEKGLREVPFNHEKVTSFVIEELLESTGKYTSLTARDIAEKMAKEITSNGTATNEVIVDAYADIIVFCGGTIGRLGYDPDKVMDEVYKEIAARTGKIIDYKFVKDEGGDTYKANFDRCKIK